MPCNPKITVVTPSYNQGRYLEQTIQSVLDQGYPQLEYIIQDGGSTDDSVEIIKRYERHLAYWSSEPDRGQSHAINKGFARSTGELLVWLNSDDYFTPGALSAVAELRLAQPEADILVGACNFVDEQGKVLSRELPPARVDSAVLLDWHEGGRIMQPSTFFSRRAWLACGPVDEELNFAMDLDLWLKFAAGYRYATTTATLSCARLHTAAKTTAEANKALVDSSLVLLRHGGERQARKMLEGMAGRLSWNEHYVGMLRDSSLFRLVRPLLTTLLGTERKWSEVGGRREERK